MYIFRETVTKRLSECIHLNQEYQKCFHKTKNKLKENPSEKQFEFRYINFIVFFPCDFMVMAMVEFNVIQASILKGWLFHPYGRTSRFGAKSPAPLYYQSSNDFAITYGN